MVLRRISATEPEVHLCIKAPSPPLITTILGKGRLGLRNDLLAVGSDTDGDTVPFFIGKLPDTRAPIGKCDFVAVGLAGPVPTFVAKAPVAPAAIGKGLFVVAPEAVALSFPVSGHTVVVTVALNTVMTRGAADAVTGVTRLDIRTKLVAFAGTAKQTLGFMDGVAPGQPVEVTSKEDANAVGQLTSAEAHFVTVITVVEPSSGADADTGRIAAFCPAAVGLDPAEVIAYPPDASAADGVTWHVVVAIFGVVFDIAGCLLETRH